MLDEMMRDGTIPLGGLKKQKIIIAKKQAHIQWEEMNNGRKN
jgi:hypothetical protein